LARFVRDPDEIFTDEKRRSLRGLRALALFASFAAATCVGAAGVAMNGEPAATFAAVGVVVGLAFLTHVFLWMAERKMRRDQHRMQNIWMARRAELQELAGRDELTQLQNRRFFYEEMTRELEVAQRFKRPLSLLMMDVDDLKLINDEFGHQIGDVCLRAFGRVMNQQAGDRNITARIGGDEFAVIMPGADRKDADKLAWAIWEALAKEAICETEHASIFLGVSIGTGGYPWGGNTLDEIVHWADTKLYANKLERKGFKRQQQQQGGNDDDSRLVGAVVDVLSSALDIRDKMTHRHARRVARMSAFVARELKLSDADVLEIEYAAALHDIGKIGVADNILRKSEALDNDEWQEMKRHSELGYQILNGIDFLHPSAEIVYSHHERFDGTGYPRGLKGEEIHLGARVFAVVDAYDAMTSRRPYREAMTRDDALEEIMRNSGTQFDPDVVSAFLTMVRSNPDGFRDENEEYGSRVLDTDAATAHGGKRRKEDMHTVDA
jgi:diguanylate cyclase (GGDEF)-like protein/putative nucleotidyltransferase with HDIG domain